MSDPPNPFALFSLRPRNGRAEQVVSHPGNEHLRVSTSTGSGAIDIGFHIHGKPPKTLATLGRGLGVDIIVEFDNISRLQCSFEIDPDTRVVMLYDRSHGRTTQVFGEKAMPFECGRGRKVLVQPGLNTLLGMGGARCDHVQFELVWYRDHEQTTETIKNAEASYRQVENPRLARTISMDMAETELPARRETRVHTPENPQLKIRYVIRERLGSGQFGVVHKAINVDSGKFMAVKILRPPVEASKQEQWKEPAYFFSRREVGALSLISHPHVVDYIGAQGWRGPQLEIFMGLKEGSLESLVNSGADTSAFANSVFSQMLQALHHIASLDIIHRDVKPENILYITGAGGRYQFQLGDFGHCSRTIDAAAFAGSHLYMAPEMFRNGGQTPKVDVWSLFVTMLWVLNAGGFREMSYTLESDEEIQRAVLSVASDVSMVSEIREMAIVNPEERASAAQMLVKRYNGDGLRVPQGQVPPLTSGTTSGTPPEIPTAPSGPTTRARARRLQRDPIIAATEEMYLTLKARDPQLSRRYRGPTGTAT